jgi:hypothetical protein
VYDPYPLGDRQGGGTPLATGTVHVVTDAWVYVTSVPISPSGTYSFSLPAGSYKLYVQPATAGFADQWVGGGGASFGAATTYALSADRSVDIALVPIPVALPVLHGTVSGGGTPLATGTVHVVTDAWVYVGSVPISPSGTYSFTLPAGRWGLNDNTGTSAANSVAGSPTGTLTNGPTWVAGFVP